MVKIFLLETYEGPQRPLGVVMAPQPKSVTPLVKLIKRGLRTEFLVSFYSRYDKRDIQWGLLPPNCSYKLRRGLRPHDYNPATCRLLSVWSTYL